MSAPWLRSRVVTCAGLAPETATQASAASTATAALHRRCLPLLFTAAIGVTGCVVNPIPVPASGGGQAIHNGGEAGRAMDGRAEQGADAASPTGFQDAGADWSSDVAAPPAEVTGSGCEESDAAPKSDAGHLSDGCSDAGDP